MLLESSCYYDSITRIVHLLGITEPDQVAGIVIVGVLHVIIQSPGFQT